MARDRVLFILKRREDYNAGAHGHSVTLSTGLYNSANYVHEMLKEAGVHTKLVVVVDNNSIDREVTLYRPTHVIIEALWVVPSKFAILSTLHPNVEWIIRLHSEMPFMAGEGIAMDWLGDYVKNPNITISCNAPRFLREVRYYLKSVMGWDDKTAIRRVIYQPNFYTQKHVKKRHRKKDGYIDIACFGAVRPLKNHLVQAHAALKFAQDKKLKLRFHINGGRIEMKGEPMINNLKGMFEQLADQGHELINHAWRPRDEFLELCSTMDIGMQVSLSETFNIVSADLINQGVPVIGSREIPWIAPEFVANPVDSNNIVRVLKRTWFWRWFNVKMNQSRLNKYTNKSKKIWLSQYH